MSGLAFIAAAISLRVISLVISMRNERNLLRKGAMEYGSHTSKAISVAHVDYYLAAISERSIRDAPESWINDLGLILYIISMCALFWVIFTLGRLWTVKIYIAPDHRLETNWVFKYVRHPNYFLNIIPELIGFALVLNAWVTLTIGLPIYLMILARRIRQEEQIMSRTFSEY